MVSSAAILRLEPFATTQICHRLFPSDRTCGIQTDNAQVLSVENPKKKLKDNQK